MIELAPLRALIRCAGSIFLILIANPLGAQTSVIPPPLPSAQDIVDRMMLRNTWQDEKLLEFHALRKFYAANVRFKTDSTMYVQTVFRRPDQLQSTVTSLQGSTFIRSRVFDKILEAENETRTKKDKQQVDIIPMNYDFALVGIENCDGRSCYRMRISPKRRDKYSLDGEVWIDAEDCSIVRIHGAPARRPSIWTLKTEIDRRYRKVAGIWLPERTDSSSNIIVAGHSVLSIEYTYDSVQTAQ
jgi:hypothetical protein